MSEWSGQGAFFLARRRKKKKKRKNKRAKHLSTPTLNGRTDRTEEVEEGELKWASLSLTHGDVQGRKEGRMDGTKTALAQIISDR